MSIEVLPVGVTCNLRCEYCYEEAGRKLTPTAKYDRKAVLNAIHKTQGWWQLFGGEPLVLNLKDLEELLALGYNQFGYTGLQTNGSLITPKHIDLFRKYNTQVGISLDGPDDLNDSRWAGTLEATRKATAKTHAAIDMVCALQREPGAYHSHGPTLIVTLHAGNCSEEAFPRFKQWIRDIDKKGVKFINFHWLELDFDAHKWFLPDDRLKQCMRELAELSGELTQMTFLNFDEAVNLLRGDGTRANCVYHACDGWSTAAVQGIMNDGSPGNCTRAVKDGIDWLPGEGFGYAAPWQIGDPFPSTRAHVRQLSLYNTPQEHGGCKGCRFFVVCTGYCPGTGFEFENGREGDWRLRSTHCEVLKTQFAETEQKLRGVGEEPITQSPDLKKIEELMIAMWTRGEYIDLGRAVQLSRNVNYDPTKTYSNLHGDLHGDHTNVSKLDAYLQQLNKSHVPHGHGDQHGDHTDASIVSTPHENLGYQEHGDHYDQSLAAIPHGDEHGDSHGDHIDLMKGRR